MKERSLPEKVIALHTVLRQNKVAHAFGGALALAYYAEPRATIDIDINVFAAAGEFDTVEKAIKPLGVDTTVDERTLERDGQCRIMWGRTPLDLFFSYDPFHEAMQKSRRRVPFAETTIEILSPEHLVACKAVFDRPKDWLDIEQILVGVDDFDRAETATWIERFAGKRDERVARFEVLADKYLETRGD